MDWFSFSFIDVIDILAVVFLVYQLYRLVRGTVAVNILIGLALVYILWKVVSYLNMDLLGGILGQFIGVGFFAVIVLFQGEIRRFLIMIGTTKLPNKGFHIFKSRFKGKVLADDKNILPIAEASFNMAKTKTGALIVIKRTTNIFKDISGGDKQKIKVTSSILESIFFKNSPLHDGAVVIDGDFIVLTRAILPVSEDKTIPKKYGLRHRAALGLAEKSDAICVVVSEERGVVEVVKGSTFISVKTQDDLIEMLAEELLA